MPHDHFHDHHAQDHPHGHTHGHAQGHHHPHNHNQSDDHLASHMHAPDEAEELKVLATQFIEGFREAADKMSYLRLAGVPLELSDGEGPGLKLVDVALTTGWQVGTASPSFGSRELSYLPFPGEMISERTNLDFIYVSIDRKKTLDLRDFLHSKLHEGTLK